MKKYEKPAIEELHIGALQLLSDSDVNNNPGNPDIQFAPGKKGSSDIDEDDNGFGEGW